MALLDPLAIVNEVGLNVTVPVEELDSVTVRAASAVFGLPFASCRCTVMLLEATPAVVVTAVEVITSFVAGPGCSVITQEDALTAVPTLTPPNVAVTVALPEPTDVGAVHVAV